MTPRVFVLAVTLVACSHPDVLASAVPTDSVAPVVASVSEPIPAASAPIAAFDRGRYPWLDEHVTVSGTLRERFAPPTDFARVPEDAGTFGAWLRELPMAPPGTPVTSYAGATIREGDHENIAGVVAIDIGTADLQQCADSVLRLFAEWRFSHGDLAQSYRAAAGMEIPYERWQRGERPVAKGASLEWKTIGKPTSGHADFRKYEDAVFMFANTGSLAASTKKIDRADVRPGDFVVLPGGPGHAVLVLDVAKAADGRKVALLGQGYMPAQSFQVLRPSPKTSWFSLEDDAGIETPFWPTFPWSALHRLD